MFRVEESLDQPSIAVCFSLAAERGGRGGSGFCDAVVWSLLPDVRGGVSGPCSLLNSHNNLFYVNHRVQGQIIGGHLFM